MAQLEPSNAAAPDLASKSAAECLKVGVVITERRRSQRPDAGEAPIDDRGAAKQIRAQLSSTDLRRFSGYLSNPRAGTGLPLRQDSPR